MFNISFLACTKVPICDLTVCIAVNGEKFRAMTLTLVGQYPISNLSKIFLYTTMYSNFIFVDRLLFELSCKNTETREHRNIETRKHTQFCKITTIIIPNLRKS